MNQLLLAELSTAKNKWHQWCSSGVVLRNINYYVINELRQNERNGDGIHEMRVYQMNLHTQQEL